MYINKKSVSCDLFALKFRISRCCSHLHARARVKCAPIHSEMPTFQPHSGQDHHQLNYKLGNNIIIWPKCEEANENYTQAQDGYA